VHFGQAVLQRSVEHHCPGVRGEELGVVSGQLRPVRHAEPADLVLAQCQPQGLMITSDTDRVHVAYQLAGLVEAIQADFSIMLPQLLELLLGNNVVSGVITGRVHRTGELFSMPRGSMPTKSKRSITPGVKKVSASAAYFAAPSPGPPGLKNSVPKRRFESLAGRRATTSEILVPDGLDQSSGTFRMPHWVCGDFSHGDQLILKRLD
jgi:hypothetical protein